MVFLPNKGTRGSGISRPPHRSFCAACYTRRNVSDMVVETGAENNGMLVCPECFDGPSPEWDETAATKTNESENDPWLSQ